MNFEDRFWNKVEKTEACWLWTGAKIRGYGSLRHESKHKYAHRVAWEIANGTIPDGLMICHHCDTPACVNPAHLFVGTQKDNLRDMTNKKRNGAFSKPESVHRGEQHCRAKLTHAIADEIRVLYKTGVWSQRKLGKEFGVSQKIINLIVNNKHWV